MSLRAWILEWVEFISGIVSHLKRKKTKLRTSDEDFFYFTITSLAFRATELFGFSTFPDE